MSLVSTTLDEFLVEEFLDVSKKALFEKTPPGMESWVKKNKKRFKKKYGKKWASWLYGTAWKIHGKKKNESLNENQSAFFDSVMNELLKMGYNEQEADFILGYSPESITDAYESGYSPNELAETLAEYVMGELKNS